MGFYKLIHKKTTTMRQQFKNNPEGYKKTDTHIYFWGSWLSNFYECPIEIRHNHDFYMLNSSEQLFMLKKAEHFGDTEIFNQLLTSPVMSPKDAKALGRKVKNFDNKEWNKVKYQCMFEALCEKFEQHNELANKLILTGERVLVEASPVDKIWGVGLHYNDPLILDDINWKGENLLGKALMQVREGLFEEELLEAKYNE